MSENDSKWLRKATLCEQIFEIGHQNKVYLTHYTLELASVKPIEEDLLRNALEHLYRKVPVLRVCLRERESELWLREMDRCIIDYKIVVGGNLEKEKDKATVHTYNAEMGPLWCVRLVSLEERPLPSSPLQEKEKEFVYNYAMIFGIHHSIADGTTNIKICNLLLNILEDLMAGGNIKDEEQLGEHTGDEMIQALYDKEMEKLKKDPELCSKIKRELTEGSKVRPLIRHICNIPPNTEFMTRNVVLTLSQVSTDSLYRKAKSEGVSLHSALTGLINLAFVSLMQESGVIQEEYVMRAGHDINVRRYYTGDTSRVLGLQGPIFGYRYSYVVPKEMLPVFWKSVRSFHKTFKADVEERTVMKTVAYRLMTEDTMANIKDLFKSDGEPNYYYTISNMGNLKGMLSEEEGKYISVKKLTRFSSLRNSCSFMCIYIHTFRGQLNFSFAYSTKFLSCDFVQRLKELVELHSVSVCSP